MERTGDSKQVNELQRKTYKFVIILILMQFLYSYLSKNELNFYNEEIAVNLSWRFLDSSEKQNVAEEKCVHVERLGNFCRNTAHLHH